MLVFLRTFYRFLSHGIESLSLSGAFFSTPCCAALSLLRYRADVRCAIHRFCEDGCCFAGGCNLPARHVALQKGDLVSARADFEKVVRPAPHRPEGPNSLGSVLPA